MGIWYRTGTIAVANGSPNVTGTLTVWSVYVRPGDRISFNGGDKWYEVLSVTDNTHLTLGSNFAETTIAGGGAYSIDLSSYRHQIESDVLELLYATLSGQTDLFETSGVPNAALGGDRSLAFDPVARVYYYKTDGVWGDPVFLGGADGVDAGFSVTFSTTTTMAEPGVGNMRFNNATLASVTAIAIDDQAADAGNPDVSNYILSWATSTSTIRGTLIFRKVGTPNTFAIYNVTGASTDNAGWTQLAVAHVASNGPFANTDQLSAVFIRAGDRGTNGTNGTNGVSAGPLFSFSTTLTMADPGTGALRMNSATPASVTALAVDDLSSLAGNPSVAEFIHALDASNSAVRGILTVSKLGSEQTFFRCAITGASVENAGWTQLAVTYLEHAGTFSNADSVVLSFSRTGDLGQDGLSAGFKFVFSSTVTMADPGSGGIRANNATLASATALAISDLAADVGSPDVSPGILTWDDSTTTGHRGLLTLRKFTASDTYVQFAITGANVDNSGWIQLAVTYVGASGTISNGDTLVAIFERTGNKGADGVGTGDVVGPGSATDGAIALFDLTTGKLIKDSAKTISTDGTLSGNSDALVPTQKAVKTYCDGLIAAADAMVYKGVIDCSASPNYPAANRGDTYRVSVAGKIGGGSGPNVEVGDMLLCLTDSTASGNHATVGSAWSIIQSNLDGAVVGPASAVSANLAAYNGTTGKIISDSGVAPSTNTALGTSNALLPTQNAVKTYVDTAVAGAGGWTTVLKTANQSRTSTVTLADDNTLTFAVAANTKYIARFNVLFNSGGTEDFKWAITGPASPTLVAITGEDVSTSGSLVSYKADNGFGTANVNTGNGTGPGLIRVLVILHNGANAGNVTLQWAQNTSGATAATVLAGSHIEYRTV